MKKFISVVLVLMLVLAFVACKNTDTKPVADDPTVTTEPTQEGTNPEAEVTPEPTEVPVTPEPTMSPEEKQDLYNNYIKSDDFKVFGDALKMEVNDEDNSNYTLISSDKALSITTERGLFGIILADENQVYIHTVVNATDTTEAKDIWKLCINEEEENGLLESFGKLDSDTLFTNLNADDTTVTYVETYTKDDVEYDVLKLVYMESEDTGEDVINVPREITLTVLANTHEVISLDAEVEDEDTGNSKVHIDFINSDGLFEIPEGLNLEPMSLENGLIEIFTYIALVMGVEY